MRRLIDLIPIVLLGMIVMAPHALAAENEGFSLGVVTTYCERIPTTFPFQGGDCRFANGIEIVAFGPDGLTIDRCTTEELGGVISGCALVIPRGVPIMVSQEMRTVESGYAPSMNQQVFNIPTDGPVEGMGGPVFTNLQTSERMDIDVLDTQDVEFDSEAWNWIVPRAPGYGNTEEGNLYFGAIVNNPTETTVHVGVSFNAYESDGTPFPGCHSPGGDGPGVSTTIAAGESALITCTRTITPINNTDLQVTAKLWDIEALSQSVDSVEIVDSRSMTSLLPPWRHSTSLSRWFDPSVLTARQHFDFDSMTSVISS